MVDTHALGACPARDGGSSPLSPTEKLKQNAIEHFVFCFWSERGLERRKQIFQQKNLLSRGRGNLRVATRKLSVTKSSPLAHKIPLFIAIY